MDQDFHYYGTFYAARVAGFNLTEATLIAKCANFIDFLNDSDYDEPWTIKQGSTTVGTVANPRYTFQGAMWSGLNPNDGLWASFHFPPGNYADTQVTQHTVNSVEANHGTAVTSKLPAFQARHVTKHTDGKPGHKLLLNRPLSPISRYLVQDTLNLAKHDDRLKAILNHAVGGSHLATDPKLVYLFKLAVLGARAHVIADTWAHQDFACISDQWLNSYWGVSSGTGVAGREDIDYWDGRGANPDPAQANQWHNVILSKLLHLNNSNLEAAPSATSYLGHGWMGHFPDFSFVRFKYKPAWDANTGTLERDNPTQYKAAFLELCSLLHKARTGKELDPADTHVKAALDAAAVAISKGVDLSQSSNVARVHSQAEWLKLNTVTDSSGGTLGKPQDEINTASEPDQKAVLEGYSNKNVKVDSEFYLFEIAADYHYRCVRDFVEKNGIYTFTASAATEDGPLPSRGIADLFKQR